MWVSDFVSCESWKEVWGLFYEIKVLGCKSGFLVLYWLVWVSGSRYGWEIIYEFKLLFKYYKLFRLEWLKDKRR